MALTAPEPTFNADMLSLARGLRGMTQAEAAAAGGVTQAMLSKVENGLVQPSPDLAESVARALGFPIEFFYQRERAHGFPHFHYRKRARLGAKTLNKIHAFINIKRQRIARLLRSYSHPRERTIPQLDLESKGLTPTDAARIVREYWLVPRGPMDNLTNWIEAAGGIVVSCNFDTMLLDGISFRAEGLPPIFVMNSEAPGDRFRHSLAHELGHMVMHSEPTENDNKMEDEANEFAAAFLMPSQEIRPYLLPPSVEKFGRVKPLWKVSIKSLIYRAHTLRLITDYQFKAFSIQYNKAGYSRGEPFPLQKEEPSSVANMINFHMRELKYTASDLATLLLMTEDEFRETYLPRRRLELVISNKK
jgi:Zn-dependent peptidase ImmA (M78 family)/DNA-binding XRE family transcriptional regulator